MNSTVKQLVIWVFLITGVICLWTFVGKNMGAVHETPVSFTDLLAKANEGRVADVTIDGTTLVGHYTNKDQFRTTIPANYPGHVRRAEQPRRQHHHQRPEFQRLGVRADQHRSLRGSDLGLWFFLLRQMQSGGNKAMSFGKIPRPPALHAAEEDHLQGRRRRR